MSVKTVVIQAVIVTVWDAVLCESIALSGGSSSSVGYLTAVGLAVVIYLVGYVLFFPGYFTLILKKKKLARSFQLPGGMPFKAVVASMGLIMTVATLVISFFPSSSLDVQANAVYQTTLGVTFVISIAIPFIIYGMRHRWTPKDMTPGGVSGASGDAGGAAPCNKRTTRFIDPMPGEPRSSSTGVTGMTADGGPRADVGTTITRGISTAVASVTSRPSGPLSVDAKDPLSTADVPAEPQPPMPDALGRSPKKAHGLTKSRKASEDVPL